MVKLEADSLNIKTAITVKLETTICMQLRHNVSMKISPMQPRLIKILWFNSRATNKTYYETVQRIVFPHPAFSFKACYLHF